MKYVQIGILVSLVLIAGLLFAIYRSQNPAAPNAQFDDESALAETTPSVDLAIPSQSARPIVDSPKPNPVVAHPPQKPRRTGARKTADTKNPEPPVSRSPEVVTATAPAPTQQREAKPALPVMVEQEAHESPTEQAPPPAPRREPRVVILPAGMELPVRLVSSLSTRRNHPGDTFYASLEQDLIVDDIVVAQRNARLEGRVLKADRAGRVKGVSRLTIELVRLHAADGQTIDIVTNRYSRQGEKSVASDAKKVGIGAGIGAAIGAIAGGGKGAAIGAAAGAGAGGGQVLTSRGKPAELPSETPLQFRLVQQVEIVEAL